jgi:DNA topoisomerase-6 subunit A
MTQKAPKGGKERMSSESTKSLLKQFGGKIVADINAQRSPSFKTVARTRSNIHYNEKEGILTLGKNTEDRNFINIAQSRRFMQTVAVAAKCNKFVSEGLHTSIRGLFYQLKYSLGEDVEENVFSEQAESNPLIEDLETALSVKREDLNLNANRKGVLAGNMKVLDRFGGEEIETDTSKMGRSGWAIPSDVDNDIEFVDLKAKYVLSVEKDALWQRLNEDGFWKKENCILMSPQGQAARGARRIIRKFADEGLPIYTFNDADAWGWYIHWTIKTGSMNLAYMGKEIATPEAHFIGVTMSDLEEFEFLKKSALKATEVDLKRAQEMLSYPWINRHKEWAEELRKVLKLKIKLEQDALQGPRLTFVDDYIRQKIKNREWLP